MSQKHLDCTIPTQSIIAALKRAGFRKAVFVQAAETTRVCTRSGFQAWKSGSVIEHVCFRFVAVQPVFGDDHHCEGEASCGVEYQMLLSQYQAALDSAGYATGVRGDSLHILERRT